MKYAVFYGVVTEIDTNETFLDCPFLGGEGIANEQSAERLMRDIADDRGIPGIVITKMYHYDNGLYEIMNLARRQFNQIANDMYSIEEVQQRKDAARRAK